MYLADLLARFDDVETGSDGYLVHCPAHSDSRQSLRLAVSDAGKVLLRCRAGCETDAVLAALSLTRRDLATMLPGDVEIARATSRDVPASPAEIARLAVTLDRYAEAFRDLGDGTPARDYLSERFGISHDDAVRLGLGYATDLGGGPRVVVPFRDRQGVARNFQGRALEKDAAVRWLGPKAPEGASWAKTGLLPGSSGWDEVLVTEGPGDGLTACALGYDAVFVAGAGQVANEHVVAEILDALDGRPAVIVGDGDAAGRRFAATLAQALAEHVPTRLLTVPDDEDLSSWRAKAVDLKTFGKAVIEAIAQAAPVQSSAAALLAWDETRYSLTDLGGARYLRDYIESRGSGVRFSEELGFFLLDRGVWRRDDRQAVRTHAQEVADLVKDLAASAKDLAEASQQAADKARAGRLARYAAHAQTTRGLDAMIRELQAVNGVPARPEDFDRHPDLLAVANGVVDLRTGTLLPHDPSLLLTRRVDLDFDPYATAPRWEAFLDEVFPAYPDLPAFMRRLVGYGVTGHTAEQSFAVLWGTGANGKSVFTDTLTEVFRELTVTTPFSTFEERQSGGIPNDLAALKGARLVMAAEGEQGRPMAESVLKRVTGKDLIAARFMRKEFFEFRPTFLLLLATNFKPAFKGQDEGLWRRVKLIPWSRFFAPEERDHRLSEHLLREAPGILAWAVRGAGEWFAGGLQDPEVIRTATTAYRTESDALDGFVPGVFVSDPDGRVDNADLFHAFQEYADEGNYLDLKRWSARAFYRALEERGFTRHKSNGTPYFAGIRRARPSDSTESQRAEGPAPAHSSSTTPPPARTMGHGPDLDAV